MSKSKNTTILTIELLPAELDTLRTIAKDHGFVVGRGREKDWGSVRQMMLAVAGGELRIEAHTAVCGES